MFDRIVIVGAGQTTASLVERLAYLAPILVLDTELDAIEHVHEAPAHGEGLKAVFAVTKLLADGTSRFVLEEARGDPEGAVAAVVATGDDRKNLEVCRLARDLDFRPIVGIVVDPASAAECEAIGARAIVRASILGQVVERALRHDGLAIATTVGLGQGEIIEFAVLPGSPAIGMPIVESESDAWRVAAIYRAGELVLPTATTAIAADDRLLIVGDPSLLPSVAEQLRIGIPMFPLRHGASVVVFLPDGRDPAIETEAEDLAKTTRASSIVRAHPRAEPSTSVLAGDAAPVSLRRGSRRVKTAVDTALEGATLEAQIEHLRRLRPGVVIARGGPRGLWDRILGRGGAPAALGNGLRAPILFARGGPRYERIVHALIEGIAEIALADTAIDLTRMLSLPLSVVRVALPEYLGAREQQADRVLHGIEQRARLYGLRAETIELEGNPVRELLRLARPTDLFVVGRRRTTRDSFTSPDIALRLAASAKCSILVQTFDAT